MNLMENREFVVVECPSCGAKHKMRKLPKKLKSFEMYTDGKTISPELSDALELSRCSQCNGIYWIDDAEISNASADELPEVQGLTVSDYLTVLGDSNSCKTTDEEMILRCELLWAFNDRVRAGKDLFENDDEKTAWTENMNALLSLLGNSDPYERLQRAEIKREMGEFEEAEEILRGIKDVQLMSMRNQLLDLVSDKDKDVAKLEQ